MPEPQPMKVTHYLLLGPLLPTAESSKQAVLTEVVRLHESGGQLNAIVVLGTAGVPAEAKSLVEDVQFACLEQGYEPAVAIVPGPYDLRTMSPRRLLARNLAEGWQEVAPDLWDGTMTEDIVQPLREDVFPDFAPWAADIADSCPDWYPGLLPGDGSLRQRVGERTIGMVCVNTVFRMVADDAPATLASCSAEQLDKAVGESFAAWAAHNDFTLLLAGRSAELPHLPPTAAPLLALAGSGEESSQGWHLPFDAAATAHLLVRVDVGGGRPVVTDTATRRQLPSAVHPRTSPASRVIPAPPQEEPYDEKPLLDDFYRYTASGQMVLVVVSGTDENVISTDTLNHRLAEAVFGSIPQPLPALHETWVAARRQLAEQQMELHLRALAAPDGQDAQTTHGLMRAPWSRIYDFTGSSTMASVHNAHLADVVSLVDACKDFPTGKRNALEAIAMHGWPGKEDAPQDFSDAWSTPGNDARSLWFRRFRAELLTRPVVFFSATANSPALWETLGISRSMSFGEDDFPRFLVTPEGTSADRARLREAGLRHIRMAPSDFVQRCLGSGIHALAEGQRVLNEEYGKTRDGVGVVRVARLVENAPAGSREFLMGRDPTWGDIKSKKIAAQLSLAAKVEERAHPAEGGRLPIVLLKGTAGSGKTTALMQFAYRLHKEGRNAGWVDRRASLPPHEVERQARQQRFEAIFVDDADMFTSRASSLLKNLNDDGRALVIAAIRVTRQSELGAGFPAEVVSSDQLLNDDDLEKIIKSLAKNALIGNLKQYFFMHQKVARLREKCDQGLLAAMIEAVTGTSLTQKVKSEFEELNQIQRAPYAVVSFSDSSLVFQQRGIDEADLLEIVSHPDPPDWSHRTAVKQLVQMNLLVRTGDGRLHCRQRTIADTVVETVLQERKGDLEWVIAKLLLFYAGRAWHIKDNRHRDRSAMIKLLNHDTMRRLDLDAESVRRIYDAAHQFLDDDHHYWLQRAEYEAEQGRLDLAKNHLAAAKNCPNGGEDRFVLTADARVRLRSSMQNPTSPQLMRAAERAVHDLSTVATKYRSQAAHAFVALAREGSRWLEKCGEALTPQKYEEVLDRITEGVALGKKCCPDNNQVGYALDESGPRLRQLIQKGPGIPI
ncbi:hypothetical protein AB0H47_23815 [Streptomyces globisporus]|uniref:P-loop NTPase n=1 Tax=Streptomyces globisporus TaxID=1908 RepID=UPI00346174D4